MATVSPSGTLVSRPSRNRTSSSATKTLTNLRRLPSSSSRRSLKPGWALSSAAEHVADGVALDRDLGAAAGQGAQGGGDADGDAHGGRRTSGFRERTGRQMVTASPPRTFLRDGVSGVRGVVAAVRGPATLPACRSTAARTTTTTRRSWPRRRATTTVSVCLPARNEATTVGTHRRHHPDRPDGGRGPGRRDPGGRRPLERRHRPRWRPSRRRHGRRRPHDAPRRRRAPARARRCGSRSTRARATSWCGATPTSSTSAPTSSPAWSARC